MKGNPVISTTEEIRVKRYNPLWIQGQGELGLIKMVGSGENGECTLKMKQEICV